MHVLVPGVLHVVVHATLVALRQASPSLKEFMEKVAWIGSFADLQQLAEEMGVGVTAVTP